MRQDDVNNNVEMIPMQKYHLEFILRAKDSSVTTIKNSLAEFGEDLEVIDYCPDAQEGHGDFKININTEEPTIIFDVCSQLGRIKSVKIDEGEEKR